MFKPLTSLLVIFTSCLLLANTAHAEFTSWFELTPKTASLKVKVSGFCNSSFTLRPMQSAKATSGIFLSTSGTLPFLDPTEASNFMFIGSFALPYNGKLFNFPAINTANTQLSIAANKGKFAAKGSVSTIDGISATSLAAVFELPNITCKDGRQIFDVIQSIPIASAMTASKYATSGKLTVSGNNKALKYSARFKSSVTTTLPEVCTERGDLSSDLANLTGSNYSWQCTKPESIVITVATVSSGAAAATDSDTLNEIFLSVFRVNNYDNDDDDEDDDGGEDGSEDFPPPAGEG